MSNLVAYLFSKTLNTNDQRTNSKDVVEIIIPLRNKEFYATNLTVNIRTEPVITKYNNIIKKKQPDFCKKFF